MLGLHFVFGVMYDAKDKSRSLGFSPGTNFSSPLKSAVFFLMNGAEQECSGYILSSALCMTELLPRQKG